MGVEIIELLKDYWQANEVGICSGVSDRLLANWTDGKGNSLPLELKKFYGEVNGMFFCFPNDADPNGLLIYPLHGLRTAESEFGAPPPENFPNCLIIGDYLHKSWWYASIQVPGKDEVEIVLMYDPYKYTKLTDSFFDFLQLYLEDGEALYVY